MAEDFPLAALRASTDQYGAGLPYSCPTPCDPDCEINGWGCHEAHDVPSHRVHGTEECKAMTLAANLRTLVESGWLVQFGESRGPDGSPACFPARPHAHSHANCHAS